MIRVFVIVGVRLYREGLAEVLGHTDALEVVGTAPDWPAAAARVAELRPDIALLDLGVAGEVEALVDAVAAAPEVRFVAFGVRETEREIVACAEAGVAGYVTRDDSLDDLVVALQLVARGEMLCSPRIAATLLRRVAALASERPHEEHTATLTPRQREIVALLEEGLPNKVIARRLNIELATVKNHVHNILEKMNVAGRAEAAARVRAQSAGRQPRHYAS